MANKRPFYTKRLILSFFLATLIFSGGFLISYFVSYSRYQSITRAQDEIRYSLLSFEIESKIIEESCLGINQRISDELDHAGNIIGILEERFGKTDSKVLEQKKDYTILLAQHFLFMRNYKEKCDEDIIIILFFYSNEKQDEKQATRIGIILSTYKQKNEKVMVYSFDYYLDVSIIKILKQKYEIEEPNIILINEQDKIKDLKSINELINYFE